MLAEFKRFAKRHPVNAGMLALAAIYTANRIREAATAPVNEYWNGIGSTTSTSTTTSSSHRTSPTSGDLMQHPTALFGIGSMSTSTSSSTAHAHKRSSYGEDVYTSPMQMMGVPSSVKRRVMVNDVGDKGMFSYQEPVAEHFYGHQATHTVSDSDIMEMAGAGGWM